MGALLALKLVLILAVPVARSDGQTASRGIVSPNIIVILADDLGWNDIGYHNPIVRTPNLDQLAYEGVRLESMYSLPLCTPSRSAFMTGRYPFTIGMQHYVIQSGSTHCLPKNLTLLPEALKRANYSTHIVGKWHLGACNVTCFPTARGFDSFLGSVTAFQDYYTKDNLEYRYMPLYDLWENAAPYIERSTYVMDLLYERAKRIVSEHNAERPLFLYLPVSLPHSPLQVPEKYRQLYPSVEDADRRIYLGMVTALDDFVGSIVTDLKAAGLYNNSIIVFSSDNGAQNTGISPVLPEVSGSNYPLRGGKGSLYEGGTRVVSFLHSPLMQTAPGTIYQGLMHMVDWYPTFLEMAGIALRESEKISLDGVSQYQSILGQAGHPRTEIVYNIDYTSHAYPLGGELTEAIRVDDYKLMLGSAGLPLHDLHNWIPPAEHTCRSQLIGDSCIGIDKDNHTTFSCLFNLKDDPLEQRNLYDQAPEVVAFLKARLQRHRGRFVHPLFQPRLPYESVHKDGVFSPTFC